MDRQDRPNHGCIFGIASSQLGYFLAAQARACGFGWDLLSHHVRSGRFIRIRRGLYRLRDYPSSPHEETMAAWLAVGQNSAVVSHASALDLLGLSDVIPDAIHLTVPRSRRHLPKLPATVIHTTSRALRPEDVTVREGIKLTAATRSIVDAAEVSAAPEQIELAIAQAIERGLATKLGLVREAVARGGRVARRIADAVGEPP